MSILSTAMSLMSFPMAHITGKFIFDGKPYGIAKFKIAFAQAIDHKGQPQHETKGGQIMVVLSEAADDPLYLWAKTAQLTKGGQIVFQTDLGISVLRINFSNAYCINLERHTNNRTGTETTLIISSEIVSMNGVEHNNFWKNAR